MNYLNVYHSRVNHMGESTAERIRNSGIRSFYKWLSESPHTVRQLSVERGLYFDGIILTDKDKSYQKIMYLNVANDISLQVGDIMNWRCDDGTIEKWILLQEEKKTNGTYRTFWIVRCNYLLKWIDKDGHLQQSWSYTVSSVDSKIKGNFRTWNNLITPQPNKYAEILMPRRPIDRATNFIIEDESWTVIEYDHTSVPGVIYLSLTENKVNLIYDDLENNIADTDKRAKYSLVLPPTIQIFHIGDTIEPVFTIMKNGVPVSMDVELVSLNKNVAHLEDGILKAIADGEADIQVKLKNCTDIEPEDLIIKIQVNSGNTEFSCYIKGEDNIRLGRTAIYRVYDTSNNEINEVSFSVDNLEMAGIKIINTTGEIKYVQESSVVPCEIKANNENKLGTFILTAVVNNQSYTKTIKIIPLW